MSERMIELQRMRLLAAGKGNRDPMHQSVPNGPISAGSDGRVGTSGVAMFGGSDSLAGLASSSLQSRQSQTPQQEALTALQIEDAHMQQFLHLLQNRNDNNANSLSGPTVPVAVSRRMLQRQGVGYLDDTVAALVSGAADRFLATVLQQSAACRDQRLKGAELAREALRHRKRHMQKYRSDADDRKRRREERELRRERANLAAIEAAQALKKRPAGGPDKSSSKDEDKYSGVSKSKKKKKTDDSVTVTNGGLRKLPTGDDDDDDNGVGGDDEDDDEASFDSIDDEEEYYQHFYGDQEPEVNDDEDDEEMLILRDITRPLEAWGFHIEGKMGAEPAADDDESDEDPADDAGAAIAAAAELDDDGMEDDLDEQMPDDDTPEAGDPAKDGKTADDDNKASRKSSSSPLPRLKTSFSALN